MCLCDFIALKVFIIYGMQITVAPRCQSPVDIQPVVVSIGQSHPLSCSVFAWPGPSSSSDFHWSLSSASQNDTSLETRTGIAINNKFANSFSSYHDDDDNAIKIHSLNFVHKLQLEYNVSSTKDYGLVSCWVQNEMGKQTQPCLFHVMSRKWVPVYETFP